MYKRTATRYFFSVITFYVVNLLSSLQAEAYRPPGHSPFWVYSPEYEDWAHPDLNQIIQLQDKTSSEGYDIEYNLYHYFEKDKGWYRFDFDRNVWINRDDPDGDGVHSALDNDDNGDGRADTMGTPSVDTDAPAANSLYWIQDPTYGWVHPELNDPDNSYERTREIDYYQYNYYWEDRGWFKWDDNKNMWVNRNDPDGDGIPSAVDDDDDNDGTPDVVDPDSDGDGDFDDATPGASSVLAGRRGADLYVTDPTAAASTGIRRGHVQEMIKRFGGGGRSRHHSTTQPNRSSYSQVSSHETFAPRSAPRTESHEAYPSNASSRDFVGAMTKRWGDRISQRSDPWDRAVWDEQRSSNLRDGLEWREPQHLLDREEARRQQARDAYIEERRGGSYDRDRRDFAADYPKRRNDVGGAGYGSRDGYRMTGPDGRQYSCTCHPVESGRTARY